MLIRKKVKGWRHGSVVKNSSAPAEGQSSILKTHIGGSQLPVTLVPGHLVASFGLHGY